jgi:hypothetical protein
VLFGIDIVRKICNHPDILYRERANEVTKRWTLIGKTICC